MRRLAVALSGLALAACTAVVPTPSPSPSGNPTTAVVPSGSPATSGLYADGIPSVLDGQPVLRASAAVAHAAAATDATPFDVGGWERPPEPLPCIAQQQHILDLSGCDRPLIADASGTEFDKGLGIMGGTQVLLAALPDSLRLQAYAPIVLVVHVHDARSEQGDTKCLGAFVVDRLIWSDDIPATLDGRPVLSIAQGDKQATTASTSQPFFVGGWFAGFGLTCGAPATSTPMSSLVPWCQGLFLTDLPYAVLVALHDTQAPIIQPIYLAGASPSLIPRSGRVVYRVHVHDPSAADCPASLRARCQIAVVVEALVWQSIPPIVPVGSASSPSPTGALP
jgi:hypothetical protein